MLCYVGYSCVQAAIPLRLFVSVFVVCVCVCVCVVSWGTTVLRVQDPLLIFVCTLSMSVYNLIEHVDG